MIIELPWKKLTLIHPDTKKTWDIELDGTMIRTCLNHGKVIEKNEKYTADKAVQKVMEKLRKGFVYCNLRACFGEPIYHTFLGKAYTGFMPVAARDDRKDFYVLRVIGQFENEILYHYREDGTLLSSICLGPGRMTFYAILNEDGTLYFDKGSLTEHHIIEHYDPKKNVFLQIKKETAIDCKELEKRNKIHTAKELTVELVRSSGIYSAAVFDSNKNKVQSICNEYIVRNANIAFSANCLLIHSDYGVLSIYNMSE